ncbi:MAG TPA: hypothetical protein VMW42_10000, partial [Desulfatiglandales bacterium]|nr:hypothetical protein [Desulfatiglandales bacterium]
MISYKRAAVKYRNFSLAFEKMCNFVAIASTQSADETLRQLILQCFAVLRDEPFEGIQHVTESIDILFGLQIPENWMQPVFQKLIAEGLIYKTPTQKYALDSDTQNKIQKGIDEASSLQESVKNEWFSEIILRFPTLETDQAWTALKSYLATAFRRHGIQTAALLDPNIDVAPEYSESLSSLLEYALKDSVLKEQRPATAEAIRFFFANIGKYPNRSRFIAQLGDGAFNYFSLTVEPESAEKFRDRLQPLTLFLDTNFLFGVLNLHVNPHVEVSNELLRSTQKYQLPFKLRYHEETDKEMRETINYYYKTLRPYKWQQGLSRAAITTHCISGIVAKYHQMNAEEGIDVDTFFGFYKHIDELLKNKGILIYKTGTRDEENISKLIQQYQIFLSKWGKDKPQKIVEHDMTVLDTVRKMRSNAQSSIEAKALLITCDFVLYRFDWETSRQEGSLACAVLPNLFWQLLRPFVPSDSDFERSFAETFALPEFRSIGSRSSEACNKMLCLLSLYKDFPEDTAARLLSNDLLINGLRKTENDNEFQDYVDNAISADNTALMEEKAALEKKIELERAKKGEKEKELEQVYQQKKKEIEALKKSMSSKQNEAKIAIEQEKQARVNAEERIDSEKKLRKRAERRSEIYASILGTILGVGGIVLFNHVIN